MKKIILLTALPVVMISIGLVYYLFGSELLQFLKPENLKNAMLTLGWWAPVVFSLLSFTLTLFFVSAAIFPIASGLLFGKLWGSVLVVFTATFTAQVAFLISRRFGSQHVASVKKRKGIGTLLERVEEKCSTNGLRNLIILRCLLLPYIALSYSAGLVRTVSGRDHLIATFLSNCLVIPGLVLLGESLLAGPEAMLLPVIVIALVFLVPRILKRFINDR